MYRVTEGRPPSSDGRPPSSDGRWLGPSDGRLVNDGRPEPGPSNDGRPESGCRSQAAGRLSAGAPSMSPMCTSIAPYALSSSAVDAVDGKVKPKRAASRTTSSEWPCALSVSSSEGPVLTGERRASNSAGPVMTGRDAEYVAAVSIASSTTGGGALLELAGPVVPSNACNFRRCSLRSKACVSSSSSSAAGGTMLELDDPLLPSIFFNLCIRSSLLLTSLASLLKSDASTSGAAAMAAAIRSSSPPALARCKRLLMRTSSLRCCTTGFGAGGSAAVTSSITGALFSPVFGCFFLTPAMISSYSLGKPLEHKRPIAKSHGII
mmetsp:Transcript_37311/g.73965  ORF Transcript_37311/g.73965 Transcript_37311/m.73965 type:complete len:321 (-) Transcript_37311:34-996(-)